MWLNLKGKLINLDNVQVIEHKYYNDINQTDLIFKGIENRSFQLENNAEAISIISHIEEGIEHGHNLVEIE